MDTFSHVGSMRISRGRLACNRWQKIIDTISQRNRLEKMRLETERQKATKGGNEFVAI